MTKPNEITERLVVQDRPRTGERPSYLRIGCIFVTTPRYNLLVAGAEDMMFRKTGAAAVLSIVALSFDVPFPAFAQSAGGPLFDAVSIKPNTTVFGPGVRSNVVTWRPDGALSMINVVLPVIVSRAYPGIGPADIAGLPDWARTERFDVNATSSLPQATADDRAAMLRAMLADRFKLVTHVEKRKQPAYDLVLARADGRLGPGMKPVETDCARVVAERTAAAEATGTPQLPSPGRPDFNAPPPQCTIRVVDATIRNLSGDRQGHLGSLLEGETTMNDFVLGLRIAVGRRVVNKTALAGSYRLVMNFDAASGRGAPPLTPTEIAAPSIFTAVQEQLGLKLEGSQADVDTLVIDRLDRPTEN
jgi:uncharacterized protein (TIGR03435 family)